MNTTALSIDLNYSGHQVRMVGTQERLEWIAADVCEVLGNGEAANVLRKFSRAEKGMYTIHTVRGPQQMLTVTEPGLYRLIFQSRKPEAEKFREWVTHEVLPTIRRHGCYPAPDFEAGNRVIVTIDEQALGRAIGTHMGILGTQIEGVANDVSVLKTDVADLKSEVSRISRRMPLTPTTQKTHVKVIFKKYRGYCPCCMDTLIVGEAEQRLSTLRFEHFHGNGQNSVEKTWAVCDKCNRALERQEEREAHRKTFDVYQAKLRALRRELNPTFPQFGDMFA